MLYVNIFGLFIYDILTPFWEPVHIHLHTVFHLSGYLAIRTVNYIFVENGADVSRSIKLTVCYFLFNIGILKYIMVLTNLKSRSNLYILYL